MIAKIRVPSLGRVEVSVAHGGQGRDQEVEGLDEAPVLEAPLEDCPSEHQRPPRRSATPWSRDHEHGGVGGELAR
jgi:hypothetical protein